MRNLVCLLLASLLVVTACKKKSKFAHSGTITGIDSTKNCSCCNGYLIHVNGDSATYRATSLPTLTPVTSATHFPVTVNFNYTLGDKCGTNQFINVSGMIITY